MNKKNILAPSLLSADFSNIERDLKIFKAHGIKYLHLDVMDGAFVPSISFGMPVIKSIRKSTDMIFDVHLMIENPLRYIEDFAEAGADIITIHAEADKHLDRTLNAIKECNLKSCIALNPATPISEIKYVLAKCDMVLLMSVNPGFGGQKYIEYSTEKIKKLAKYRDEHHFDFDIEVDGGITKDNVKTVLDAGANVIVAGSAIYKGDVERNVIDFLDILN